MKYLLKFALFLIIIFFNLNVCRAQFLSIQDSPVVAEVYESSGVAWVDFDKDGDDDLFVTVSSGLAAFSSKDILFINNGDGSFAKATSGEIISEDGTGRGSSWGDYDNDGLIDAFVVNQLFLILHKNIGGGILSKVQQPPTTVTFSFAQDFSGSAWGDYDGDGFIDLFVAAYQLDATGRNFFFRNNGNGTFTQKPDSFIETPTGGGMDVTWIDYNNDSFLDLFVPNYGGNNSLYSNKGDGSFQKVDIIGLTTKPLQSIGSSWADYDNDGDFDVAVLTNVNEKNHFFENNGDGTFTEKSNLISSIQATSGAWGDYDNDGFIDIILVGNTSDRKSYLFKNNGDKTFNDVSGVQGIGNTNYSQGVAWADYNKDGFLDLFIANGIDDSGTAKDVLYKNTPNQNKWISFKLIGKNSNKSSLGAVVKIKTPAGWQMETVQSQTGKNSQNSLNVEFGLGKNSKVDTLLIEWPRKGYQHLVNIESNSFLEITEIDFLQAPIGLTGANNIINSVELNWTDNYPNETGFRIERSKGDIKNFKYVAATAANTSSFKDTGLQAGVTYYYRLAVEKDNGFSLYSATSSVYVKKTQTVVFEPIGEKFLDSEPFGLKAFASSGLTVSFEISEGQDKISLIVDQVTILNLGTSKVTAKQKGNELFFPAVPIEQSLDIKFITGLQDELYLGITVSPNPTKNFINIMMPENGQHSIKVFNSLGYFVDSIDFQGQANKFWVDHLPVGLYMLVGNYGVAKFIVTY